MKSEAAKMADGPENAGQPKGSRTVNEAAKDLLHLLPSDEEDTGEASGSPEDEESSTGVEDDVEEFEDGEEDEGDEEESADEDLDEDEDLYEVVVGGKTQQVTLQELLAGYSRTADYTRKTQAAAEERKQAEQLQEQLRSEREQYGQRLELVEQALTQLQPQEPNWEELKRRNPQGYATKWAEWQQHQQQLQTVQAERQRVFEEQQRDYQERMKRLMAEERDRLLEAIPEWKDESKQKTEVSAIVDYAQDLGYSAEDLQQIYDHRALLVMRKAMLFDQLTTEGKKKLRGKKKVAETLKPGQRKRRKRSVRKQSETARKRLADSGHVNDAAAAILSGGILGE